MLILNVPSLELPYGISYTDRHQYETPHKLSVKLRLSIKKHILGRFEWFIITRAVQFRVLK